LEDTDNPSTNTISSSFGQLSFRADTGNQLANSRIDFKVDGSERMRIDSSGNVGIGRIPATRLDVEVTDATVFSSSSSGNILTLRNTNTTSGNFAGIAFSSSGTGGDAATAHINVTGTTSGNGNLVFSTRGSSTVAERMRIDSSGNLLVGTTTATGVAGGTTVGTVIEDNGVLLVGGTSVTSYFNRQGSDGDITVFRKDGTTVGSIGVKSSGLVVGNTTANSALRFTANSITAFDPVTQTDTGADGDTSLGNSAVRFKDLYLSGGVYLGGTGAANKLDDYETGTFTPSVIASGTNPTVSYTARTGSYVKVGSSVTVHVYILLSSFSGGSGTVQVGSLPFTPTSTRCSGSLSYSSGFPTAPQACLNSSSSPSVTLYYFSGSSVVGVATTDLNGNEQFRLSLTYEV
jgi:hypothetical protein